MNCFKCGGILEEIITDLPFKVNHNAIIIIKKLPVLQCQNCNEYLIEDKVMKKTDKILDKTNNNAELEVLSYAV